ncbi:MAG TPA: alanine racemase, partial [Gammaproteobacteria bacterium]|nr:alanine racemase [Gammaproteobacteria bacterium]
MPTTSTPTPTTEAPAARADIDLGALRHNLVVARERAPGRRVMAVVKSLAYGHGLLPVARALADAADALAVARCEEGAALREAGIQTPLVVLEGFSSQAELGLARQHRLLPVLHDPHQLALLREATDPAPLPCWVKFDTGMHRLGFDWREADRVLAQLRAMPQLRIQGLMTHLANADDTADHTTAEQLRRLAAVPRDGLPLSVANSAGILGWPDSHADWVRPGLMLYGASPLQGRSAGYALAIEAIIKSLGPMILPWALKSAR